MTRTAKILADGFSCLYPQQLLEGTLIKNRSVFRPCLGGLLPKRFRLLGNIWGIFLIIAKMSPLNESEVGETTLQTGEGGSPSKGALSLLLVNTMDYLSMAGRT